MKQLPTCVAAVALALLTLAANAKTVVVTDVQNGKALTLVAGDTLVVRLTTNTGLGATEWHVVYNPNMLLQLNEPLSGPSRSFPLPPPHSIVVVGLGDPLTQEFRFTVPRSKGSFVNGAWLRFLSLSDFEPGIQGAKVWKIKYTIKAAK